MSTYYNEDTKTGWKLNPKDSEDRGWTYYEKDVKKTPGTSLGRALRSGLTIMNDYLLTPPSVRKAKKEGTYEPTMTYRDTLPGQMQTLGELTIGGISNIAKNVIDRVTLAPGTKGETVHDLKQNLRIIKDQKTAELEAKYGAK